jgi:hypothetical protein
MNEHSLKARIVRRNTTNTWSNTWIKNCLDSFPREHNKERLKEVAALHMNELLMRALDRWAAEETGKEDAICDWF